MIFLTCCLLLITLYLFDRNSRWLNKIIYANDLFCKFAKYSRSELIGKDHRIVNSGVHPKEFWKNCWDTVKSGKTWKAEVANKAKDGTIYWLDGTIVPFKNSKGEITQYIAIRSDITDRRNGEIKIREAQQKVAQSQRLSAIGVLAAGVGHEINNPLTISSGNLSVVRRLLKGKEINWPKVETALEKQEIANERIRKIVDGLRVYARVDEDELEVTSLDIAINQTISLLFEIFEKEGVKIHKHFSDSKLLVKGTIGKLQQVLMNILVNAKDASKGQNSRTIDIFLERTGKSNVLVSIKDNGCGIPNDIKNQIFEPFFTTKEVGEGTGMGLGIVSKIISNIGGEITVESEVNCGSTFNISLPLQESSCNQEKKTEQLCTVIMPKNVLVVDDEKEIRKILTSTLKELGVINIIEAENGQIALDKIKENQFDVVFSDLCMPVMSGQELFKHINDLSLEKKPITIVITGGIDTDLDQLMAHQQIDEYILKPFRESEVENILAKVLAKLKSRSEKAA